MKHSYIGILFSLLISSCGQSQDNASASTDDVSQPNDSFNDYWYAGKAEVSSYELRQARYGEMRQGTATLIFVTEPFSKKKQVKLDNPQQAGDDKLTVMKLNFTKKFTTGIYPYSMMLSSFTPVDRYHFPNTLKVTMSGQEWCGHVFAQMNFNGTGYDVRSFSYFESEGDKNFTLENTWLEDEIWNLIRLDYESLPTGDIKVIPGLFATRLMHDELTPLDTRAAIAMSNGEATYSLTYKNGRTLKISFSTKFPHKILSWEETYKGLGGKEMTTTGQLKETLHTDYWNKNKNADVHLRDSLGLN